MGQPHIITTLAEGGAEHQLRLLLRRLPHDCEVVTLSRPGAVAAALRAEGTTVHEVITTRDRDLSAVIRLRRLIRLGHFDVVHTHLYRACVQGLFAARLAGKPAKVRIVACMRKLIVALNAIVRDGAQWQPRTA